MLQVVGRQISMASPQEVTPKGDPRTLDYIEGGADSPLYYETETQDDYLIFPPNKTQATTLSIYTFPTSTPEAERQDYTETIYTTKSQTDHPWWQFWKCKLVKGDEKSKRFPKLCREFVKYSQSNYIHRTKMIRETHQDLLETD